MQFLQKNKALLVLTLTLFTPNANVPIGKDTKKFNNFYQISGW